MARAFSTGSRNGRVARELLEALGSSLDVRLVLERAYPLLERLVPADYGALGVSSSGRAEDYRWIVAKLPEAFFAAYPEMAAHDFVRRSVALSPNVVLRDEDMVSRRELEGNVMYRRAREVGAPLEHVMAVMLHVDHRWQSGLSLYRERRRPFSIAERGLLQSLAPAISNAVRNCHLFEAAVDLGAALDGALARQGASVVVAAPDGREIARSGDATRLLEKWFGPDERAAGRLPDALAAVLARSAAAPEGAARPAVFERRGADSSLDVSFLPLAAPASEARWMLVLRERSQGALVPSVWRAVLTPRECQVVEALLRGWDNRLVSSELGCSEGTVKKHLQSVFDKLGVSSRTALLAKAAELRV